MTTINRQNFFLLISVFIFLITSGLVNKSFQKPIINVTKQESAVNFNDYFLLFIGASNTRLLTDTFWVTTLIESDFDHYKKKDLNSWMYLRFKTITFLDPKYLMAYQFGGKYLSIVKDDLLGAEKIFDNGIKYYPNDYQLNFDAGFLYAFEMDKPEKAIIHYDRIKDNPKAPDYITGIINKLKFKSTNDLDLAFKINMDRYKELKEGPMKRKVWLDLYAIKAEIDLNCLNSNKTNCQLKDFEGNLYIKKDGGFKARKEFKKYRFRKRRRGNPPPNN